MAADPLPHFDCMSKSFVWGQDTWTARCI